MMAEGSRYESAEDYDGDHRCACGDPGAMPPCDHCTSCPGAEGEYHNQALARRYEEVARKVLLEEQRETQERLAVQRLVGPIDQAIDQAIFLILGDEEQWA